jgi:hypothetical protein
MGDDGFRPLGGHSAKIDGDLVFLRVKGVVNLADMKEFMRVQGEVKRKYGAVFVLYDSRENTGLDREARKYATDNAAPDHRATAAASFGAPFGMRVLVNMLNRAHEMLKVEGTRVHLFDTEAEARRHLDSERRRLQAAAAA